MRVLGHYGVLGRLVTPGVAVVGSLPTVLREVGTSWLSWPDSWVFAWVFGVTVSIGYGTCTGCGGTCVGCSGTCVGCNTLVQETERGGSRLTDSRKESKIVFQFLFLVFRAPFLVLFFLRQRRFSRVQGAFKEELLPFYQTRAVEEGNEEAVSCLWRGLVSRQLSNFTKEFAKRFQNLRSIEILVSIGFKIFILGNRRQIISIKT